jgi:hypothetical protein|tara:strand:- start:4137 stop:4424 length:288 start_codon:yes stop_codon:yes gene_type:complete
MASSENKHDEATHEEVEDMVAAVSKWFDSPTGEAYRKWSEQNRHPALANHLLVDTAQETPDNIQTGISTVFMLGAMSMRRWMEDIAERTRQMVGQ